MKELGFIIKNKNREDLYITVLIGLFTLNLFLSNLGLYGGRTSPSLLAGSISLLLLSVLMIKNRKMGLKFPAKRWIPFIVIGILFLIYGIQFRVPTYILYAFIFLFQMPLFIFSIDRKILSKIMLNFSKWFVLFYGLYVVASFLISPLEAGQYCGVFTNPNLWGECAAAAILVILYLMEKTSNVKFKFYLFALFGIAIANVIFSRSRTTLITVIGIIFVYAVYLVRVKAVDKKKIGCFIAAMALGVSITYGILAHITPYTADAIGIEIGEMDLSGGFEKSLSATYERYMKGINNEGSLSSGRFEIWKTYIPELSIFGHDPADLPIKGYFDQGFETNAHNTFIQIGYQSGIPALILFAFQFIVMGIYYLKKMFGKEFGSEDYLLVAAFAQAIIYMMLSNSFGPYSSFSVLSYWMFILPSYMIRDEEPCSVEGILPKRSYFK